MRRLTLTMTQEMALLALLREADFPVHRMSLSKLVGKLKGRERARDLHYRQTAALVEARLAAEGWPERIAARVERRRVS